MSKAKPFSSTPKDCRWFLAKLKGQDRWEQIRREARIGHITGRFIRVSHNGMQVATADLYSHWAKLPKVKRVDPNEAPLMVWAPGIGWHSILPDPLIDPEKLKTRF